MKECLTRYSRSGHLSIYPDRVIDSLTENDILCSLTAVGGVGPRQTPLVMSCDALTRLSLAVSRPGRLPTVIDRAAQKCWQACSKDS